MKLVLAVPIAAAAALLAPLADAQPAEIAPEDWKRLVKAVRVIQREALVVVDDAPLAQACLRQLQAAPALRQAALPSVSRLTDVPPMLRAAASAAPGIAPGGLVTECIAGMAGAVDARSRYIPPDESREMTIAGLAGVGLELAARDGAVLVVDVVDDSPAVAAGIRAGDRLAAIGGRSVDGLELHEVTRRLRGRAGSTVTVSLARGAEIIERTITRAIVKRATVRPRVVGAGILHLVVRRFEEPTLSDIDTAIAPLLEQAATTPRALLLDLRDDPGGLFRQAIDFAGGLLPPGAVVGSTEGRAPAGRRPMTGERAWARGDVAGWLRSVPMAVLVNEGTGSGAEIVAAALQAHGRATILGTPTAGATSIQTLVPMDDGGYLRLTTTRWLTPKGEPLDGRPVTPDILLVTRRVASDAAPPRDAALEQAIEILRKRGTPSR